MMKKNNILAITLLGGFALLAAGCVKESDINEMYRPEGTPIVFTAATGYDNGESTRTEYSGHFFNGNTELGPTDPLSSYNNSWERIDWVNNDPVTIYYKHPDNSSTNAGYTVSSKTDNVVNSDATIQVASGSTKLTWAGGSGNHIFTAMYPSYGFDGNNGSQYANTSVTFDGTDVGGLIPKTQILRPVSGSSGKYLPQMQYAYMVARKTIPGTSTDHTVYLPFKPAYTAFEFRLKKPASLPNGSPYSYKVKSFTISSSAALAGNFHLTIDGEDAKGATWSNTPTVTYNGNRSTSVSVTFNGNTGVDLSTSTELDFTILTLPTAIPDLTLTLTFADPANTSKSITLKDGASNRSFTPCKKYIITNYNAGFDDWEYIIEEIPDLVTYGHETVLKDFQVRSYKRSKVNPSYTVAVPWQIQYTTVANPTASDWHNLTASGYNNTLMATSLFKIRNIADDGDGFTGSGSIPGDPYELRNSKIEGTHTSMEYGQPGAADATRAKLAAADQRGDPVGTGNGPFDLSMHPSYGSINSTVRQTTANSYVISAPGYYMFPCVYGNAITDGSTNVSAYNPSQASDAVTGQSQFTTLGGVQTYKNKNSAKRVYYTPGFYNALNQFISDPWIKTDLTYYDASATFKDAVVVWQDTHVNDEIIPYNPTSPNIGMTTVNIGGTDRDYIWFYVDKEHIKPGNIMIALRGSSSGLSGNKNIFWSWQIWVTEKDLTPTSNDVLNGYSLMPYNLGWIDSENGTVDKYKDRDLKYRVLQVENSVEHESEEFTMTQIGDAVQTYATIGGNPYYQWGRKDPFLSALPDGTATSRPVSPNSDYSTVVTATGAVIPAAEISDQTTDYATGITHPYIPYNNTGSGVGSTSWIGGPVYPYKQQGVAYESFYFRNTMNYVNHQHHYTRAIATAIGLNSNVYPVSGLDFGFIGETRYDYWCHNGATGELLTINQVDDECYDAAGTYGGTGKTRNDFYVVNGEPYTALQRSTASCPYNLWNSYLYDEDAPNAGTDNKFKTVYDPCPPGFTVPVKDVFAPGVTSSDFTWSMRIEKRISPAFATYSSSSQGVTFGSSFFPFTGARIYFTVNNAPELRVTDVATDGMYWTDCAHTIDFDMYFYDNGAADQTVIGYYSLYHSAISFDFTGSENYVKSYTRGSALSMRPMRDPKYTPTPVTP